MRRADLGPGAAGALGGLAATVLLTALKTVTGLPLLVEAVSDRALPHLPVDQFLQLLGLLGGPITAKEIAYWSGFLGQVAAGAALGAVLGRHRRRRQLLAAACAGVWVLLAVALWPVLGQSYLGYSPAQARAVNLASLAAGLLAFAAVFEASLAVSGGEAKNSAPARPGLTLSRRRLLLLGGGVALAASLGIQARSLFGKGSFVYDGTLLRGPVTPITPNHSFYIVTKNLIDPDVLEADWRLRVGGLVQHELSFTLDELAALPSRTQLTTLECISNGVGYGLISNAEWTGVPLGELLRRAGHRAPAGWVNLHAADGFSHSLSVEMAMRDTTLIAYRMNGYFLPHLHGFPARLIAPGTYGEVNVKWLTEIELVRERVPGYYDTQGWKPDHVHTMSRIDEPRSGETIHLSGGPVPIHGIAFAGERGIAGVEVNDGRGWMPARIDYGPSPLAWSLWSLEWRPPGPGSYDLVVRATDGAGRLQESRSHGTAPAGATGYMHRRVTVVG